MHGELKVLFPVKTNKRIEIVAGPNGSGKSTFAQAYFKLRNGKSRFINADTIAAGLAAGKESQNSFHAGRVVLAAVKEALDRSESFAFESTLSGLTWRPILLDAIERGYIITIYFVFLLNPRLNLIRIRQRVREGGHSIPKDTVLRRYPRSFDNFWNVYRPLCSEWFLFDNSKKQPKQIQSKRDYEKFSLPEKALFETFFLQLKGRR